MAQEPKRRLSSTDWAEAALTAMGTGGPAAVAVEPLAAGLGATKGSFYWHFANREALVVAALERWEQTYTEDVLSRVDTEPDPIGRLRVLFATVTAPDRAPVEVGLHAAADHPLLTAAVHRAVGRRTGYISDQLELLGVPRAEAERRALLVYALYLGHVQLAVRIPDALPREQAELDAYLGTALELVLPRSGAGRT
jgi:AcrR family transcriptional regulator